MGEVSALLRHETGYRRLLYIRPTIEGQLEPGSSVQDPPIYRGDKKRICHYSGVEEAVQGLERSWKGLQPIASSKRVDECVYASHQHVER